MDFYGNYFWASQNEYVKPAIGGSMLFLNNARVVINTVFAGIFDRFPELQMVVGRERRRLDPVHPRDDGLRAPRERAAQAAELSKLPSEYFRRNWYATFWFEENQGDVQGLLDKVGDDHVLFETDFPHPTCLYPSPLETVADEDERAAPGDAPQGHGRERRPPLPAVGSPTPCRHGSAMKSSRTGAASTHGANSAPVPAAWAAAACSQASSGQGGSINRDPLINVCTSYDVRFGWS